MKLYKIIISFRSMTACLGEGLLVENSRAIDFLYELMLIHSLIPTGGHLNHFTLVSVFKQD